MLTIKISTFVILAIKFWLIKEISRDIKKHVKVLIVYNAQNVKKHFQVKKVNINI